MSIIKLTPEQEDALVRHRVARAVPTAKTFIFEDTNPTPARIEYIEQRIAASSFIKAAIWTTQTIEDETFVEGYIVANATLTENQARSELGWPNMVSPCFGTRDANWLLRQHCPTHKSIVKQENKPNGRVSFDYLLDHNPTKLKKQHVGRRRREHIRRLLQTSNREYLYATYEKSQYKRAEIEYDEVARQYSNTAAV